MNCEIKKIVYTPETYDKEDQLKDPAHYALALKVEITPEVIEALQAVMAGGSPYAHLELQPEQPTLFSNTAVTEAEPAKAEAS